MSGQTTIRIADIPFAVDYYMEDGQPCFDCSYVDGQPVEDGLYAKNRKGEIVSLEFVLQEGLDDIADEIMADQQASIADERMDYRRNA